MTNLECHFPLRDGSPHGPCCIYFYFFSGISEEMLPILVDVSTAKEVNFQDKFEPPS